MPESKRLRLRVGERLLEADFFVRVSPGLQLELTLESSGSGRSKGKVTHRNPDYKEALEVILRRISRVASSLDDCLVDSTTVHENGLGEEARRVTPTTPFSYPVTLDNDLDFTRLRRALSGPQAAVGSKAKRGGNSTKRILLKFTSRVVTNTLEDVIEALVAEEVGPGMNSRTDIVVGLEAESINGVLAEWRTIGAGAFHAKYGTSPTQRFIIADPDGAEFDAMAVLIAARAVAGLDGTQEQFRQDRTTVGAPLAHLGFVVEEVNVKSAPDEETAELPAPEDSEVAINLAKRFAGKTDASSVRRVRREQKTLRWALGLGTGSHQCGICGRTLPDRLLVAAHIKKRAECDDFEKIDIPAVAFVACVVGCDALYENGYIAVNEHGVSFALRQSHDPDLTKVIAGLVGRPVGGFADLSAKYFSWHREYWHRFIAEP